jgi:hypothetical protein
VCPPDPPSHPRISGVPVVERNSQKLAGILTNRDVRFASNPKQPVAELMTKDKLITVRENVDRETAKRLLHQHRIEKLWEAFARQMVGNVAGPKYVSCWHETLAVNMATGYSAVTGRMQAVVLHAGVGLMQGSMGVHGARKWNTPMMVMSGEALTFGDDESFRDEN